MRKICLIVCISILLFSSLTAQSKTNWDRKNATYLDIGGWALWYSLNYEHRISLADNHRLGLGGGMMIIPPTKDASLLAGLHVNYLLGKTHNLEIGITHPCFLVKKKNFCFHPGLAIASNLPEDFYSASGCRRFRL